MSDLTEYFSQQDEITALKGEIKALKARVRRGQSSTKYKSKLLESGAIIRSTKVLTVLTNLVIAGRLDMGNIEMGETCFVTAKSAGNFKAKLRGKSSC